MRAMIIAAALSVGAPPIAMAQPMTCGAESDPAVAGVLAARTAFNKAIADKNIDAIAAVLAEDVLLVTGTGSDIFTGRAAQLPLWEEDFAADHRVLYERTSGCVSVSPLRPIALETGAWRGVNTANADDFAAGTFAAKWRVIDGAWRLEAEIYSTESCGGSYCPDAESGG